MHDIAVNIHTVDGEMFSVTIYTVVEVPYGPALKLVMEDTAPKYAVGDLVERFINTVREVREFLDRAKRNIDEVVADIKRIDRKIDVVVVFNPKKYLEKRLGEKGVKVELG